jgi:hypothetical protein
MALNVSAQDGNYGMNKEMPTWNQIPPEQREQMQRMAAGILPPNNSFSPPMVSSTGAGLAAQNSSGVGNLSIVTVSNSTNSTVSASSLYNGTLTGPGGVSAATAHVPMFSLLVVFVGFFYSV